MEATNHNRRAALGILATGPVAMLPALAVISCSEKANAAGVSSTMAVAVQRYHMASEALTAFNQGTHEPALKHYEAEVDRLPHYATKQRLEFSDGLKPLRTSDQALVGVARRFVATPRNERQRQTERSRDPEYWDAMHELTALADKREAELEGLSRKHGIDELRDMEDRHLSALSDAEDAVVDHPVASIHDLAAKAAVITDAMLWDAERVGKRIAADITKLAGGA